ncbi:homocysteine S-methyltransferase family protein [Microvirga sp. G4-2]|uniref:homocysteine S-methyltransferase family protein n=1 Tax=Microvirga sp. G4-2 TaxID=3434467 RepID=UPI0040439F29
MALYRSNLPQLSGGDFLTDGRLPSGDTLQEAIERVYAAAGSGPIYSMVNCAHPTHFDSTVGTEDTWLKRVKGIRANATTLSHAELDAATALDAGDLAALGRHYQSLRRKMTQLCVLGGCCGTDHSHIVAACEACNPRFGLASNHAQKLRKVS